MDIKRLKYNANSFDGVVCVFSLIHIPKTDIEKALNEIARVLKNGCPLFISVYHGKGEALVAEPLLEGEEIFVKYYSEKEIKGLLVKAGFSIIKLEEVSEEAKGVLGSTAIYITAKKS